MTLEERIEEGDNVEAPRLQSDGAKVVAGDGGPPGHVGMMKG